MQYSTIQFCITVHHSMRKYAYPVSGKTHYSDLTNVSYSGKLPVGVLNGNPLVAQNVQNQKLQRPKLSKIPTVQIIMCTKSSVYNKNVVISSLSK